MTSFEWQSIPEPELVPYHTLAPLPVRSILALAPHPDDEIFGLGGTLALAVDQGVAVRVVVLTDGGVGGDAVVRERESRMAAEEIGYASQPDGLSFWRYPDRGLVPDAALVARIADTWSAARSDWLLAPSPHEVHPDHRAACLAAIEAAAQVGATLGFYEIGQPQVPGVLIDVTAVRERKRRAMACFVSQLAGQRYDEHIDALNRCRAYTLGPAVSHAESLWFADPSDLAGSVRGIFAAQARVLARKLGL